MNPEPWEIDVKVYDAEQNLRMSEAFTCIQPGMMQQGPHWTFTHQ